MGLVISNAYKGDNFRKIISPKEPTPFEYFDDIVANKIKLYSPPVKPSARNFTQFLKAYKSDSYKMLPGIHCLLLPYESINDEDPSKSLLASHLLYSLLKLSPEEKVVALENCTPPYDFSKQVSFVLNITSILPYSEEKVKSYYL